MATKILAQAVELASGATIGAIVISVFLSVALGISTKKLWMMIGTLQIIAHFPLLRIQFPSNALLCFQALIEVANLNILPKEASNKVLSIMGTD